MKYGGQFAVPQPPMNSESLSVLPQDLPDSPFPSQGAPRPCWTSQAWISLLRAPPTQPCPPALVTRPALSNPAPPYPCLMMSSCLWVRKGPGPEWGVRLRGVMLTTHAAYRAWSVPRVTPPSGLCSMRGGLRLRESRSLCKITSSQGEVGQALHLISQQYPGSKGNGDFPAAG